MCLEEPTNTPKEKKRRKFREKFITKKDLLNLKSNKSGESGEILIIKQVEQPPDFMNILEVVESCEQSSKQDQPTASTSHDQKADFQDKDLLERQRELPPKVPETSKDVISKVKQRYLEEKSSKRRTKHSPRKMVEGSVLSTLDTSSPIIQQIKNHPSFNSTVIKFWSDDQVNEEFPAVLVHPSLKSVVSSFLRLENRELNEIPQHMKLTINNLIMYLKTNDTIQHFAQIVLNVNSSGGIQFFCKQLALLTQHESVEGMYDDWYATAVLMYHVITNF